MAEAPSSAASKQRVAVPGMCNTGNTCYLNAALQAMASSQLLCDGISQLAGILQASSSSSSAGQQQSAAGQLLAAVKAAVKFILHGGWQLYAFSSCTSSPVFELWTIQCSFLCKVLAALTCPSCPCAAS
jgi:hypothetical protein